MMDSHGKTLMTTYFLLIATMTKTMFVNSQQVLFIIPFLCELITLYKIHMISYARVTIQSQFQV